MKDREAFFVTGIMAILAGLFLMIFVQSMPIDTGVIIQISTISDGVFLIVMGIAIVIASSKKWNSDE